MKIETKFNIGQEVFTLYKCKYENGLTSKRYNLLHGTIKSIKVIIFIDKIKISYYMDCSMPQFYSDFYEEEVLFATKEEAELKLKELENEEKK